uniref:Annexin n=1 Tax=Phytophthora ramorum TaxID=164328 RepID=H3HAD7_PHYRM
ETTEETEETSETTEETTTVTSEDVSRDSVTGLATSAIGVATVAATGAAIGSAVSATTRPATTSANVGSTEATETTEAVISEDVGDDVTRSVTERGDYAVTSGWTSGTGANQQTTETSETTETTEETTVTEEGESVTTGATRLVTSGSTETTETTEITTEETTETTEETEETSETTEETTTVTSEDVSRDSVTGLATSAIGVATVAATGAAIGSAVSATTRPATTSANVGSTGVLKTLASGSVASRRLGGAKMEYEKTLVVIGLAGSTMAESKLRKVKEVSFGWSWLSQFVSFCEKWGKDVSAISPDELRELSRDFCSKSFSTFSENLYENGSRDEKRAAWNVSQTLSVHFPELAVHQFGVEFGQHKRILMIDEVASEDKKTTKAASPEVLTSMLKESPELSGDYEHVLITEGGETVFYGSAKSLMTFFQEFGFAKPQSIDFGEFLLGLSANGNAQYHVTVIDGANKEKENQQTQSLSSFVSFADDSVLFAGSDFSAQIEKPMNDDNQISSGIQTSSTAHRSTSETERASAGSVTVRSAESGGESSAALVAAGTAAMSSLYARYAREGSSVESMTFSADIDAAAQEIQRVCTGAASDETALASLLLSKTAEQRYLIWWRYRILYKQSLTVWVKSTSDYGILLKMLASPLEHVEAEILRKATKGLGTTEEWIYPVVMARSNAEIALLKKTFQEKYGDDLVQILRGELSGDLKKVILTAIRGEVADFDASVHTSAKAAADADVLYKAGEGRVGTDETTFINILVLSPAEHLRSINR